MPARCFTCGIWHHPSAVGLADEHDLEVSKLRRELESCTERERGNFEEVKVHSERYAAVDILMMDSLRAALEELETEREESAALREALVDARAAMQHMGDSLNEMDAVEEEDEKHFPAFEKADRALVSSSAGADYSARVQGLVDALERFDGCDAGSLFDSPPCGDCDSCLARAALSTFRGGR